MNLMFEEELNSVMMFVVGNNLNKRKVEPNKANLKSSKAGINSENDVHFERANRVL